MIFLFLAQVPNATPTQIGEWLVSFAAVAALAAAVKVLVVRKPSIESEFATKAEIKEVEDKIDSSNMSNLRVTGELHEKVNTVAQDVSFIRGNLEGRSAERAELVDALRDVLRAK